MHRAKLLVIPIAILVQAGALVAETPSGVVARAPVVLDESWPGAFELLEPYRLDCMATERLRGAELEEARARVNRCVTKRLLAAGELFRVLRHGFPHEITPERLSRCLRRELRPNETLACLRAER